MPNWYGYKKVWKLFGILYLNMIFRINIIISINLICGIIKNLIILVEIYFIFEKCRN